MDIAYDHIAEETYSDRATTPKPTSTSTATTSSAPTNRPNLNTEFQETFRAFSNSPWGAKLGGLWGNVRKQGESYYEEAKREVGEAGGEALRGFTDLKEQLVSRTRGLSLGEEERNPDRDGLVQQGAMPTMKDATAEKSGGGSSPSGSGPGIAEKEEKARTESEVIRENDSLVARFRAEAAKRLKDLEKAEDAADEALLRFGTNIRNFLRDAVSVAPPSEEDSAAGGKERSEVLFESKDAAGKRVLHTTRLDAQLHVIHTTPDKFTRDPESDEWVAFRDKFEVEEQTQRIAEDLERYPELRKAMEQLVPENVEYKAFWCRYYFLRMVLETEEQRRKEMLKGASSQATEDEGVDWDADSDDNDENTSSTPQGSQPPAPAPAPAPARISHKPNDSTTTIHLQQSGTITMTDNDHDNHDENNNNKLKPEGGGRRSHDRQSQPDSDASYDLVSGATSRAPGSPRLDTTGRAKEKRDEESDEEDWE